VYRYNFQNKMKNNIRITIPEPCHENWLEMTPSEKGRFCSNCQRNVIDFTKASDREILTAYTKNNNLCGRFNSTQLNRKITTPKEKNSFWMMAAASVITFLGLGNQSIKAQETIKTEQTDKKQVSDSISRKSSTKTEYSGILYDENNIPLPGGFVIIKGTKIKTETNINGEFSIIAKKGDVLVFQYMGYKNEKFKLKNNTSIKAKMKAIYALGLGEVIILNSDN
jgi:hypothetical protein